jgi:hypothetical protein
MLILWKQLNSSNAYKKLRKWGWGGGGGGGIGSAPLTSCIYIYFIYKYIIFTKIAILITYSWMHRDDKDRGMGIFFAVTQATLWFPCTRVGVREISVVRKRKFVGRDWELATNILYIYFIYKYIIFTKIAILITYSWKLGDNKVCGMDNFFLRWHRRHRHSPLVMWVWER